MGAAHTVDTSTGTSTSALRSWDSLARAAAVVAGSAGVLGLTGHLAGLRWLVQPWGVGPAPPVHGALCLAVLGASTLGALGPLRARRPSAALGIALCAYGAFAIHASVRALLAHEAGAAPLPRLMDVGTAASVTALGATIAVLALRPGLRAPIAIASATTLALALISLLAYSLDVATLSRHGAEMPFLVAIALAIYGAGVLGWAWHRDGAEAGLPMPSWSPLIAALAASALFLGFMIATEGDSAVLQAALALGAAAKLASTVHRQIGERRAEAALRRRESAARRAAEATTAEARAQREWLEGVLDLAPVPLVLIDPQRGRVSFANEAAAQLGGGGFPPDGRDDVAYVDALGRPLPESETPHARVLRGERLDGADVVLRTPDGARELFVHGALIGPMHGQPPVGVLALQDITRLRRAEEVSVRLGRMLDETPTEIYAVDASSLRFVEANAAARRNLGYRDRELRALTPMDLAPELTRDGLLALLEPLRTGERDQVTLETTQRRKDGTLYPVEARIQMSRSETPPVFVALVENVTARRRADAERAHLLEREQAARREADASRARFAFLADASRALAEPVDLEATLRAVVRTPLPRLADWALLVLADEGGLRRVAADATPSSPARDALARTLARDPVPAAIDERTPLRSAITTGRVVVTEDLHPERVREALALSTDEAAAAARSLGARAFATVPLRARGHVVGALTLALAGERASFGSADRALAEEYGARAALAIDDALLYDDATAAIRAREEFLSIASSDLRMPLSLLQLRADAMARSIRARGAPPAEQVAEFAESASRYAARLAVLIDDLLDPTRVTGERLRLSLERVDLAALVGNVVARFGERLALAGSSVELSAPETVEGVWDRFRVEQVVGNLLSNAIKYGAGAPVEVSVEAEPEVARLRVRDHGVGMSEERIARIFSLSERGVSARHYGGVGLGLYLVHRIVETLGGTIEVRSRPGEGSTFTVTLPRHRAGELTA